MKKKGFTLIELLAVIVILAIIALITVPVVIKIINNSKKGAAEDSAYGVVEAAKLFWMSNQVDFVNNNSDVTFTCGSNGECTSTFTGTTTALEISGTKPTSGSVKIKNGAISVINLQFGEYYCNKAKTEEKITCGETEAEVPQEDLTYTISFETDGGTIMLPKVVEPGETLGTVSNPRKIGYTFTGWLDGESNPVTSSTPITSDIILYAQYEIKNVTVTFNSDGGSSVDSITFQEGSMIDPLPETTKAGNNFLGWFNGQEQLTTSKMIMNDTTYTAHWEERTVTVTFNSDGGSNVSSQTLNEGGTISSIPTSTKLGYTLAGWYDTSNNELTTSTVINESKTYTAHWNVKNFTVTFNSNGGSSVSSMQVQEGGTISTLPTTTKSGSEFLGWYDSNDGILSTSTVINESKTYTARWYNAYANAGQVVYYDPVSASKCSTYNVNNIKAGISTCYKWYKIKEDATTTTIMLDHNLGTAVSQWYTANDSTYGPITALTNLASYTSGWNSSLLLNYTYDTTAATYNYGVLTCTSGSCYVNGSSTSFVTGLKARLITGEEVAGVTSTKTNGTTAADSWSLVESNNRSFYFSNTTYPTGTTTFNYQGNKDLAWLVDNTYSKGESGATTDIYKTNSMSFNEGYWTLSPSNIKTYCRYVSAIGYFNYCNCSTGNTYGVRPVITVPKSVLN